MLAESLWGMFQELAATMGTVSNTMMLPRSDIITLRMSHRTPWLGKTLGSRSSSVHSVLDSTPWFLGYSMPFKDQLGGMLQCKVKWANKETLWKTVQGFFSSLRHPCCVASATFHCMYFCSSKKDKPFIRFPSV